MRCQEKTKSWQCGSHSMPNSDRCYQHDPKEKERRSAVAHNRGVRQKSKRPFIMLAEDAFQLWDNMNPIRS